MNVASTATSGNVPHVSGMCAQDARRLQAARLPWDARRRRDEVATGGDFIGSCIVT